MSSAQDLDGLVYRFLQGRAYAGERLLAGVRLLVLALAGLRLGVVMDERILRETSQAVFTYFAWGVATVVALGITAWVVRGGGRRWLPWVSALVDPVAVTGILLPSVLWAQPGVRALIYEPDGYIFLASTAALGVRVRWGPALLGAAANLGGFFGLLALDWQLNGRGPVHQGDLAMAGIVCVAAGGVAVVSTFWTRSLVMHGAQAALVARRGREVLGRMVAPEVLAQALSGEALAPRRRIAAVLFSDLRDFTRIAEAADPAVLLAELNGYLRVMVRVIEAHGGHVDKFIGDAIMAVFMDDAEPNRAAAQALACGQAMSAALQAHNSDRVADGLPPLRHGVGVHVGPVISGPVGSPDRMEFTVTGGTVNLASRLEAATKAHPFEGLCSADVVDAARWVAATDGPVGTLAGLESVGPLAIRGQTAPVAAFGWRAPAPPTPPPGEIGP